MYIIKHFLKIFSKNHLKIIKSIMSVDGWVEIYNADKINANGLTDLFF